MLKNKLINLIFIWVLVTLVSIRRILDQTETMSGPHRISLLAGAIMLINTLRLKVCFVTPKTSLRTTR